MKDTQRAILLVIISAMFNSAGQIFWKLGANFSNTLGVLSSFLNLWFVVGCISFALSAVLVVAAFRLGELSVLYPIIATSYVWVSLISPMIFPQDSMNILKGVGVLVILLSVSLLGAKSGSGNKNDTIQKKVVVNG